MTREPGYLPSNRFHGSPGGVSWQEVLLLRLSVDQADPVGLLRAAFVDAQGHQVRDILVAWLMSLAPGVDPAHAARAMLPAGELAPGSIGDELAEIARWPADRLRHLARERRRRAF